MTRDDILRMAREAGWSGTYVIQWADEPTGEPDWHPVKESISVPVTMEQIERFAALVEAAKEAEHQQTLALQQRSYEREIELEVEAEREACAQIADAHASCEGIAQRVAAAIRTRGNT